MSIKKTTPERLTAFSDAVFAVIITIMVLDLKPPEEATTDGIAAFVAHGFELCRQLSFHRNHLGQPSPPDRIHTRSNSSTDLVELRSSFYDLAGAGDHGLDGQYAVGRCSGVYLCAGLCLG